MEFLSGAKGAQIVAQKLNGSNASSVNTRLFHTNVGSVPFGSSVNGDFTRDIRNTFINTFELENAYPRERILMSTGEIAGETCISQIFLWAP